MRCNCPYVICKLHGDCAACIAHNVQTNCLAHCMEEIAMQKGASLPIGLPDRVYLERDEEAMSQRSAMLIAQTARQRPDALFSLAAGNTAIRTYQILRAMAEKGEADFSKAHFVALDEWLDLQDETENCNAFMMKHFYGPLRIRESQITRFDIHLPDIQEACRRVDQAIQNHGGIDLMLLGLGMNGHLGLNEPGGDFDRYACVVDLDETTARVGQKYFSGSIRLSRGITLGVRHMFESRCVILQVSGEHKAEILEKMVLTPPTEKLPATVLKILPHGVLVTDRAAAGRVIPILEKSGRAWIDGRKTGGSAG